MLEGNQLICNIVMAWTSREDKLSIRVEKGTKPRLKLDRNQQDVIVTIPAETFVNWPPVKAELAGGYIVVVQKMQQQYKISVQHNHDKKPEIVVYSSPLSYEKDIKTHLKELNTRVNQVSIAGPNLEVRGVLNARRLTLEATSGTMHVNAKIVCERLSLNAQNVVIANEALLSASIFKSICRKMQLDGRIYPSESSTQPRQMNVDIESNLVHLGVDGCIGESNEKENCATKRQEKYVQITCDSLSLRINGSLANYGKIVAIDTISLQIAGSIVSLADGSLDSAGRGYSALKQIKGIRTSTDSTPSSSHMQAAIVDQDAATAAQLIEHGVDLNDKSRDNHQTLRQTAARLYREKVKQSTQNKFREKITLINALFSVHNWRRGTITAQAICALIGKNCEDCAQFAASQLQLKIGASGMVEADSIWNCTWVEVDVGAHFKISGQVKQKTLILNVGESIITTKDAIISEEMFARLNCKNFDCDGIWTVGENFAIEITHNGILRQNSHLESDKIELSCGGELQLEGSWQVAVCWLKVSGTTILAQTGKFFVEENLSLTAQSLYSSGFVNVTDICELHLKESAHFFGGSKLESNIFKLVCEAYCTLGGAWIAENIEVYARADLITTCAGKVTAYNKVSVTTGAFKNDSAWQVERDFKLVVGEMEQSEDGILFVKQNLEMTIHAESPESWSGRILTSRLSMRCMKYCQYDGFLRANEAEIYLPYQGESQLKITGQWDILCGALTVKGNSHVPENSTDPHPFPGVVFAGKLTAAAIIGPFMAVEISEDAAVRLTTVTSSNPETPFRILVSVAWLTVGKGSVISSLTTDHVAEGIICASTWYHQGQIRFNSEIVFLLIGTWVNYGRVTNTEGKQNHVKSCSVTIEELLLNVSTIACGTIEVLGEGILDNRGRIFAADNMNIRLSNFHNDEGVIESRDRMHLLSAGKQWTKLSGAIKARRGLDLCAHKLQVAVKDAKSLSRDEKLSFAARCDLVIATPVADENRRLALGCAARRSIAIESTIEIDRFEILLGGTSCDGPVFLLLRDSADVICNALVVNGEAKELHIIVDGSLRCGRINVAKGFEKVFVNGKGHLEVNSLLAKASNVIFDVYQLLVLGELTAESVHVAKDSIFRPQPVIEGDNTSIICNRFTSEGTVFVESRLFLESASCICMQVSGSYIGSSKDSEISIEAGRLDITGQLANFKFLEVYTRDRSNFNNIRVKNIRGIAIDSGEFNFSGEFDACDNVVINSAVSSLGGVCKANKGASFSLYTTSLNSTMHFSDLEKVTFGSRRSAKLGGSFVKVDIVEADAKWLVNSASFEQCLTVQLSAWSMHLKSKLDVNDLQVTSLGVILITAPVSCNAGKFVAPFIVALPHALPEIGEVHSLLLVSNSPQHSGLTYLHLCFENTLIETKLTQCEANSWKDSADMMKDRFNTKSVDVEEMLLGLKYIADLNPVHISLDSEGALHSQLQKMCAKFEKSPINVFSVAELVNIVHRGRNLYVVGNSPSKAPKRQKKQLSCLYECLSAFRSSRYEAECRGASDADGGYASRSSSEDLDGKGRRSSSISGGSPPPHESPLFHSDHLSHIDQRLEESINLNTEYTADNINSSFIEEEEELLEFEELEQEIEDAERGILRTDYIICRDRRINLARLKQKAFMTAVHRPRPQFPILRVPSSNDLVMKRLQVKNTMSTLDLRSFGSESSLASIDFVNHGEVGSPMQFSVSPFQRSRIPRSFRSPRKDSPLPTNITNRLLNY